MDAEVVNDCSRLVAKALKIIKDHLANDDGSATPLETAEVYLEQALDKLANNIG